MLLIIWGMKDANMRMVCREWNAYKNAYLNWWMQTASHTSTGRPVDGLLLPTCGSASFPHDYVQYVLSLFLTPKSPFVVN
jgi:hypothetical protein